jgi:FkbM family methyltransferase
VRSASERLKVSLVAFLLGLPLGAGNWLAVRVASRFREEAVVRSKLGFNLIVGGGPLVADLRAAMLAGTHESALVRLVRAAARRGSVAIDVGAHEGYFALALADAVGADGHVYAVEPLPENVSTLRRNLDANGLQNVVIVDAAAGESDGRATLRGNGPWGSLVAPVVTEGDLHQVRVFPLDALLETTPDAVRTSVIKVDAEGNEIAIFRGARRLIERSRPVIAFEVNLSLLAYVTASIAEVFDGLTTTGYELFVERNGRLVPHDWLRDRVSNYVAIPSERTSEEWVSSFRSHGDHEGGLNA